MKNYKILLPKSIKGKGYCGVWRDGKIGWNIPNHLTGFKNQTDKPYLREFDFDEDDRLYLCEITIKPLKDKLGRPITKLAKKAIEN